MRYLQQLKTPLLLLLLLPACTAPLVETDPSVLTDTSHVTLTWNARQGNKGLLGYTDPVYVHLGVITDSSTHPNEWRYVRFKWGKTEEAALATAAGADRWRYTIPNIRKFFGVSEKEKILELAVLLRSGNCIDTFCKVLRNADRTDIHIPVQAAGTN